MRNPVPIAQHVRDVFLRNFGTEPRIFTAPGRVNIIGEHTDYNEGFVLPAAIDKSVYLAIGPSKGTAATWISIDFNSQANINFREIAHHELGWANYLLGMVDQFRKQGADVAPFHAVLSADIPIGAGLSSSAALESVMAVALDAISGASIGSLELARMAQRSENQFIGLQCGIMDMFASIHGRKDHVIRLDCRDLSYQYFPLELGDHYIVLMDTGVRHSLATSEYNLRRQQCEAGVQVIARDHPGIRSLRDVDAGLLRAHEHRMDPLVYRRCAYVVAENARVGALCDALNQGDLHTVGQLMYASHEGLQHAYEVSCPELDLLVDLVRDQPGVLGSRMMGGGFGGCTISIVHQDAVAALGEKTGRAYQAKTGRTMQSHEVITGDGARELTGYQNI